MSKNLSHYWRLAVTVAILAFLHSSCHLSFAQVPVIEANSTTQVALLNHLSGLDKDQLDKLRDLTRWFNESYGSGTAYADVYSFLRDLGLAERLTEVLNYQVRATTVYLRNWSRMRDTGFNPAVISSLVAQVNGCLKTVRQLSELSKRIMRDAGLSRNEKKLAVEKIIADMESRVLSNGREMGAEIVFLSESRGALEFLNLLDGREPSYGLSCLGGVRPVSGGSLSGVSLPSPELPYVPEGGVSVSDALGDAEGYETATSAYRNGFYVVSLLLAFLALGSLVTAFVRYGRGDYGAERIFVRVAVALVAGAFLLAILTRFVGFGV